MEELVEAIFNAPIATLFVVAGLVFLLIAVVGRISGKIEPGTGGRIVSGVIGLILLGVGLALYVESPDPSSPPTSIAEASPTAKVPSTLEVPPTTPTPTLEVPPTTPTRTDTATPPPTPGYVSIRLPETYLRHDRHSMAAEGFAYPLRGSQTLGGIDFEFVGEGSFVQTQFQYEDEPYSGTMPQEVSIWAEVDGARKVYVLMNLAYGCAKWAPRNSLVGEIEFVFDDGTSEKTFLRTGYNIREWSIGATQYCGGPIIDRVESIATVQQVWQSYRQNSSVLTVIDMHVFELPSERSGQRLREIVIRDTSSYTGGHVNPAIIVFAITVLV